MRDVIAFALGARERRAFSLFHFKITARTSERHLALVTDYFLSAVFLNNKQVKKSEIHPFQCD